MFAAVFQILKDESSLDLIIASYQLLFELNKVLFGHSFYDILKFRFNQAYPSLQRYPWVYLPKMEKSESSTPSKVHCGLIVAEEVTVLFLIGAIFFMSMTAFLFVQNT